ncbi:MAG: beta-lactamase family protein [Planctomycetes bacterium]|nr:beta-lactamase family protein [Planctomycetota bacterium]
MNQSDERSRRDVLKSLGYAGLSVALFPRLGRGRPSAANAMRITGPAVPALAEFDTAMCDFMQARSIPGGSLALTHKERLVLARGYGAGEQDLTVKSTSLFRIASVSKPLTATAMLRLVQDEQTTLSTRVSDILEGQAPGPGTGDPYREEMTVQHLLQHLGGWDRGKTFDPMFRDFEIAKAQGVALPIQKQDIMDSMKGQPLQHRPGQTYAYSNYGYLLLGRMIEAITGRSYEDYVRATVLAPLGIVRPRLARTLPEHRYPNEVTYHSSNSGKTVFDASGRQVPAPYGAWNIENMDAHGGWLASAVDLVRFAASFDGLDASPVLSPAAIKKMFQLPGNRPADVYQRGDAYYGCGWSVRDWGNGRRNTWHGGSLPGAHTLLVRRWRDSLNWCVLFNQREDPSGLSYSDIDPLLHKAADSVKAWPTHDLFREFLALE